MEEEDQEIIIIIIIEIIILLIIHTPTITTTIITTIITISLIDQRLTSHPIAEEVDITEEEAGITEEVGNTMGVVEEGDTEVEEEEDN